MGRRRLLQCSWLEVLRELKARGLAKTPKLAICDSAMGFQQFVPSLDSIPDLDKIVKDFINHFKKKIILVIPIFLLYSLAIFIIKLVLSI